MDRLNGQGELIKSMAANGIVMAPAIGFVLTMYIDNMIGVHADEPHKGTATVEDIAELKESINNAEKQVIEIKAEVGKNSEISTLIQEGNKRDHQYQKEQLDLILDELREMRRDG